MMRVTPRKPFKTNIKHKKYLDYLNSQKIPLNLLSLAKKEFNVNPFNITCQNFKLFHNSFLKTLIFHRFDLSQMI